MISVEAEQVYVVGMAQIRRCARLRGFAGVHVFSRACCGIGSDVPLDFFQKDEEGCVVDLPALCVHEDE